MNRPHLSLIAVTLGGFVFVAMHQGQSEQPASPRVHRTVEINGYHAGNATTYRIPLQRDALYAMEIDGNRGYHVAGNPLDDGGAQFVGTFPLDKSAFQVEVTKNDDGQIAGYQVRLRNVRYGDLNGDGKIDYLCETGQRSRRWRIVLDDRFVDVQDSKNISFGAKSLDGQTLYAFEKGSWKIARRNQGLQSILRELERFGKK